MVGLGVLDGVVVLVAVAELVGVLVAVAELVGVLVAVADGVAVFVAVAVMVGVAVAASTVTQFENSEVLRLLKSVAVPVTWEPMGAVIIGA